MINFYRRPHRRPLYFVVLLGDSGRINVTYLIISAIMRYFSYQNGCSFFSNFKKNYVIDHSPLYDQFV